MILAVEPVRRGRSLQPRRLIFVSNVRGQRNAECRSRAGDGPGYMTSVFYLNVSSTRQLIQVHVTRQLAARAKELSPLLSPHENMVLISYHTCAEQFQAEPLL
jgi:hypothetical protein